MREDYRAWADLLLLAMPISLPPEALARAAVKLMGASTLPHNPRQSPNGIPLDLPSCDHQYHILQLYTSCKHKQKQVLWSGRGVAHVLVRKHPRDLIMQVWKQASSQLILQCLPVSAFRLPSSWMRLEAALHQVAHSEWACNIAAVLLRSHGAACHEAEHFQAVKIGVPN